MVKRPWFFSIGLLLTIFGGVLAAAGVALIFDMDAAPFSIIVGSVSGVVGVNLVSGSFDPE